MLDSMVMQAQETLKTELRSKQSEDYYQTTRTTCFICFSYKIMWQEYFKAGYV
jgi:hypothetical protein